MALTFKRLAGLVILCGLSLPAFGQSVRILGDHNQWSAYATTESAGRICFAMTTPTAVEPRPEGYGEGHFYITHRPTEGVRTEINIVAGYNFAPDAGNAQRRGAGVPPLYARGRRLACRSGPIGCRRASHPRRFVDDGRGHVRARGPGAAGLFAVGGNGGLARDRQRLPLTRPALRRDPGCVKGASPLTAQDALPMFAPHTLVFGNHTS